MKVKNIKWRQLVRVKDLDEPILVRYGHTRHKLSKDSVLECTANCLDDDGHVRLCTTDGEDFYYYTIPDNLRKVKEC